MAKSKFNPSFYQNFTTNDKGELTYDDNTWKQIDARNAAVQKIDDANKLKQQIQSETEAVILESQKEIKKKSGLLMQIGGGVQTYSNPRNWARATVGLGKMIFGQTIETTVTGGKAIGEQNAATNLYTQSKDLADQAAKIVKTDRPQAESLLRQSQALIEEANKFAQGESTKKIMGADDKLTTKEIIGKSALTAIEVGSLAPIGSVAKGSFVLAKTVPPAVQGTKTVAVGNTITRALGLGDIYQVTKTGLQQGLKQEVKQTILGQAAKATLQAPVTAGLIEMADDDGVNNYMGSLLTTGVGAFGLTLSLGYVGRVLGGATGEVVSGVTQQLNKKSAAAVTDLTGAMPVPKEQAQIGTTQRLMLPEATQATTTIDGQQVGLPTSPYSKLGAFNPETDIPMIDITETIKPNNIDFNPDSVMSINATRKAVDDIALLNGNEVGGKKLKINTDDPKYKEIYNNQIKPLVDRINKVDADVEAPSVKVDPLVEEARQYKSAEEFVKAKQDIPYSKEINNLVEGYANSEKEITKINELIDKKRTSIQYDDKNKNKIQKEIDVLVNKIKNFEEGNKSAIKQLSEITKVDEYNLIAGISDYIDIGKRTKNTTLDNFYKYTKRDKQQLEDIYNQAQAVDKVAERLEFDDFFRQYNRKVGELQDKSMASIDLTFKLDKEIYGGKLESKRQEIEKVWQKWKKSNGENPEEFMQTKTYQSLEKERMDIVREIKNNPEVKKLDLEADKLSDEIDKFKKDYELSKIPVEDVEMEVQKIYSELENAGINITPEQVRQTPNIQVVDDKMSKGEQFTPEEFDKGMQEYVNSTGKTEVIDGVQEELTGPMKKSAYVERLNKENPGLDLTSVEYQSAVVEDLKEKAINLIETNFDEAGKIAKSINKNSTLQDIKIAEEYNNKLIELGKYDELAQTSHTLSIEATRAGQRTGILQEKKMGTPQYAIKQAQDARINKLKPQVDKQVAKVKQQMSSVKVDQTFLSDILDNITCR